MLVGRVRHGPDLAHSCLEQQQRRQGQQQHRRHFGVVVMRQHQWMLMQQQKHFNGPVFTSSSSSRDSSNSRGGDHAHPSPNVAVRQQLQAAMTRRQQQRLQPLPPLLLLLLLLLLLSTSLPLATAAAKLGVPPLLNASGRTAHATAAAGGLPLLLLLVPWAVGMGCTQWACPHHRPLRTCPSQGDCWVGGQLGGDLQGGWQGVVAAAAAPWGLVGVHSLSRKGVAMTLGVGGRHQHPHSSSSSSRVGDQGILAVTQITIKVDQGALMTREDSRGSRPVGQAGTRPATRRDLQCPSSSSSSQVANGEGMGKEVLRPAIVFTTAMTVVITASLATTTARMTDSRPATPASLAVAATPTLTATALSSSTPPSSSTSHRSSTAPCSTVAAAIQLLLLLLFLSFPQQAPLWPLPKGRALKWCQGGGMQQQGQQQGVGVLLCLSL